MSQPRLRILILRRRLRGKPGSATSRHRNVGVAAILSVTLAACGTGSRSNSGPSEPTASTSVVPSPSSSAPAEALPRIDTPVDPGSTVEGLLEVDSHDIYARCSGDGAPTILYLTGWAGDPGDPPKLATDIAVGIEDALGAGYRVCSYDRRNAGRSESVDGSQGPNDVIADVDGVLAALDEEGPFVLLGASYGGLIASAYAVAHPERVTGVVLLDADTAMDNALDRRFGFQGACLDANREFDANESLERIDNCRLEKWVHERRAREPDVPMLYLASADASERGSEGDPVVKAWVRSWSPGTFRVVGAPHWMDEADPELVAGAVREVIELAS